jgi:hypothetical protein
MEVQNCLICVCSCANDSLSVMYLCQQKSTNLLGVLGLVSKALDLAGFYYSEKVKVKKTMWTQHTWTSTGKYIYQFSSLLVYSYRLEQLNQYKYVPHVHYPCRLVCIDLMNWK